MGDAEAELLLLAGKSLSHVRRINRIPLSSAIASQAHEIVTASGSSFDVDPSSSSTPKARSRKRESSPPHSPYKARAPYTPRRTGLAEKAASAPASPFGGMDDLLQAAQTVLVPSSDPGARTAKRRKNSPSPGPGGMGWVPASAGGLALLREEDEFSALDLLAQASSSQEGKAALGTSFQPAPSVALKLSKAEAATVVANEMAVSGIKGVRSPYQRVRPPFSSFFSARSN